jgi:hypothetical protein
VHILLLLVFSLVYVLPAAAQWSGMEPSGSPVISDWDMTTPQPRSGNHVPLGNGWTTFSGRTSAASDCNDLVSPCGVLQMDFAGTVGGSSPGNIYFNGASGKTEVFVGYEFSTSAPFTSHPGGTKTFFVQSTNGAWNVVPHLEINGSLTGPWILGVYFPSGNTALGIPGANNCHLPNRGTSDCPGTVHLFPNVASAPIVAGTHYKIALYVKLSTCPTCQNGILRMWLNGTMVMNHTNVNWPAVNIGELQMNPTYGGTGGSATGGFFRYGHVHVSLPNCPAPCGGGVIDNPSGPPAAPTGVTAIVE